MITEEAGTMPGLEGVDESIRELKDIQGIDWAG